MGSLISCMRPGAITTYALPSQGQTPVGPGVLADDLQRAANTPGLRLTELPVVAFASIAHHVAMDACSARSLNVALLGEQSDGARDAASEMAYVMRTRDERERLFIEALPDADADVASDPDFMADLADHLRSCYGESQPPGDIAACVRIWPEFRALLLRVPSRWLQERIPLSTVRAHVEKIERRLSWAVGFPSALELNARWHHVRRAIAPFDEAWLEAWLDMLEPDRISRYSHHEDLRERIGAARDATLSMIQSSLPAGEYAADRLIEWVLDPAIATARLRIVCECMGGHPVYRGLAHTLALDAWLREPAISVQRLARVLAHVCPLDEWADGRDREPEHRQPLNPLTAALMSPEVSDERVARVLRYGAERHRQGARPVPSWIERIVASADLTRSTGTPPSVPPDPAEIAAFPAYSLLLRAISPDYTDEAVLHVLDGIDANAFDCGSVEQLSQQLADASLPGNTPFASSGRRRPEPMPPARADELRALCQSLGLRCGADHFGDGVMSDLHFRLYALANEIDGGTRRYGGCSQTMTDCLEALLSALEALPTSGDVRGACARAQALVGAVHRWTDYPLYAAQACRIIGLATEVGNRLEVA